jgi:DNA helicase HerA-like ATPase
VGKVCSLLDKVLGWAADLAMKVNYLDVLNVFRIGENHIHLDPAGRFKVYGVKLTSETNCLAQLDSLASVTTEVRHKQIDSRIVLYYVKREDHQAVYVFTFAPSVARQIAGQFDVPLMSGDEILLSLYDIYDIGKVKVNGENRFIYSEDPRGKKHFVSWRVGMIAEQFYGRLKNATERLLSEGRVYQGVEVFNKDSFSVVDLFSVPWEGHVALSIDVASPSVMQRLKYYEMVASKGDIEFSDVIRNIQKNPENSKTLDKISHESALLNVYGYFKESSLDYVEITGEKLGVNFEENVLTGPSILGQSMLRTKDADFDLIVPTDYLSRYFATTHKRQPPPDIFAHWWGHDISGNLINYSLYENNSPHTLYIGKTGAGKSRQAINGLEQILGFDKETKEASRFYDFYTRYTDVGYTAGHMAVSLQEHYGDDVKIFSSEVSKLRFALFDIDVDDGEVDEDQLDFSIGLINFALEIKGEKDRYGNVGLSGSEAVFLKNIVKDVISKKKYSDPYLDELHRDKAYQEIIEELYKKGFHESTLCSELPREYRQFQHPTLDDIIKEAETQSGISSYSELEREDVTSLTKKLRSLSSLKFLTKYSNVKMTEERFTHIDFDEIKDNPEQFCIIYWMLVKQWIMIMKRNKKRSIAKKTSNPKTLFYVDEAHNFFRYETFVHLLTVATKEFRKYDGLLFFLSQEMSDLPQQIVNQIGTRVFMVAPKDRGLLKGMIRSVLQSLDKEDEEVIDRIKNYQMYIKCEKGSLGLKYDTDPKYDWFYTPYHPEFNKV